MIIKKKREISRRTIKSHLSISEQLRKFNLVNDEILLKIKEIPLEYLIALKLEDATDTVGFLKFQSLDFVHYIEEITKRGFYLALLSAPGNLSLAARAIVEKRTESKIKTGYKKIRDALDSRMVHDLRDPNELRVDRIELIQMYTKSVPKNFVNKKFRDDYLRKSTRQKAMYTHFSLFTKSLLEKYEEAKNKDYVLDATCFENEEKTFDDLLRDLTAERKAAMLIHSFEIEEEPEQCQVQQELSPMTPLEKRSTSET